MAFTAHGSNFVQFTAGGYYPSTVVTRKIFKANFFFDLWFKFVNLYA